MRQYRDLDAGPGRPAQAPQEGHVGRTAGQLRQRQLVVAPGEPAGRIKQPVAGSITDAPAHGAGREHRLAVAHRAERRRRKVRDAANGDAGEILEGRERCIDLGADEHAVRQHVVVTGLQSLEKASRFREGINGLRKIERAGDAGRRPIRASPSIAEMAAGIKTSPVEIGGNRRRRRRRLRHHDVIGRGATHRGQRHANNSPEDQLLHRDPTALRCPFSTVIVTFISSPKTFASSAVRSVL